MSAWLDPVRRALAADAAPVTIFFRDDDAGWEDEKLYRLLSVMTRFHMPVALAAIPMAIGSQLAAELGRLLAAGSRVVSVHQHGFAHVNHEPSGRRFEFGAARSRDLQRQDLAHGRERLQHALGCSLPPIFTPPWNRCTRETAECLVELDFEVLSRDVSAQPFGLAPLHELPVGLDWSGRRGARTGAAHWGAAIARMIASARTIGPLGGPEREFCPRCGRPHSGPSRAKRGKRDGQPTEGLRGNITWRSPLVGFMLHHAVMTTDDRRMLSELLRVFAERSNVAVRQMFDVATASQACRGTPSCVS